MKMKRTNPLSIFNNLGNKNLGKLEISDEKHHGPSFNKERKEHKSC
jgi:hypothetical protein